MKNWMLNFIQARACCVTEQAQAQHSGPVLRCCSTMGRAVAAVAVAGRAARRHSPRPQAPPAQLAGMPPPQAHGFWGILLLAAYPNAAFDLCGICCGHFLMPFWEFFGATLIGKGGIKVGWGQVVAGRCNLCWVGCCGSTLIGMKPWRAGCKGSADWQTGAARRLAPDAGLHTLCQCGSRLVAGTWECSASLPSSTWEHPASLLTHCLSRFLPVLPCPADCRADRLLCGYL